MPIHNPPFIQGLTPKVFSPFPDADRIHEYYGDEVALYFAWMSFMCRWLAVPGCLGLATFFLHEVTGARPRVVWQPPHLGFHSEWLGAFSRDRHIG